MFDKLVDLIIQFIHLFQIYHYIDPYMRGVVIRCGVYHRPAEPGVVWTLPFKVDQILWTNVKPQPVSTPPLSLTTSDGHKVVVQATFIATIDEPKTFLLDLDGGQAAILRMAELVLARFVESRPWAELSLGETRDGAQEKSSSHRLTIAYRAYVKPYGVGVRDGQITMKTESRSIHLLGVHA